MQFDLGILGGGQLARMTIMAAQQMGLRCLSLDPGQMTPAGQVAPTAQGSLNDPEAVAGIFSHCARVTLENEFIPASVIAQALELSGRDPSTVIPGFETLGIIQDKLSQRKALLAKGVPSPKAEEIAEDGTVAVARIGFPAVLKARFGGYDGKGTKFARSGEEFDDLRPIWENGGWMAEEFVEFKRELAVMVYRSPTVTGWFPTMETVQTSFVCDLVFPANIDASEVAVAAVEAVDGYGLFGVELFETNDGRILVNEIAPRPHNSGHYTMDWGGLSQFECIARLALGLPVPEPVGEPACMANLLGQTDADNFRLGIMKALTADADIRIHWYGKEESRKGRKMGHINVTGPNMVARAEAARAAFYEGVKQSPVPPKEVVSEFPS